MTVQALRPRRDRYRHDRHRRECHRCGRPAAVVVLTPYRQPLYACGYHKREWRPAIVHSLFAPYFTGMEPSTDL